MLDVKSNSSQSASASPSGIPLAFQSSVAPSRGAIISLTRWLQEVGVTACTAWRWRKKGWLKTVNICGRQYLTQEAIEEFRGRAKRGEFAQVHKAPSRSGVAS
jgi:hypothetical protein